MAIRQIVRVGDEILRMRAKEVTAFDDRLCQLLDDMKETMLAANGVGLAAPQVGILKRVCVVCVDGVEFFELINPTIAKKERNSVRRGGLFERSRAQRQGGAPQKIDGEFPYPNGRKGSIQGERLYGGGVLP
jgi:peptide deformylase